MMKEHRHCISYHNIKDSMPITEQFSILKNLKAYLETGRVILPGRGSPISKDLFSCRYSTHEEIIKTVSTRVLLLAYIVSKLNLGNDHVYIVTTDDDEGAISGVKVPRGKFEEFGGANDVPV